MVAVELAQSGLENLSGSPERKFIDENYVVGHPPFGDPALIEREQISGSQRRARPSRGSSLSSPSRMPISTPNTARPCFTLRSRCDSFGSVLCLVWSLEMVATGLVSVMPQTCSISTP